MAATARLGEFRLPGYGVNVGRGEADRRAGPESPQPRRDRPIEQFAAKRPTMNLRDPDDQSLTPERVDARQKGELDEVPDFQPANLFPKLDVVNACLPPHPLDVLDPDRVPHG